MFLKKILFATLLSMGFMTYAVAATEGVDYRTLPKVMPQEQKDKVEVLEFFGYFCPHCKNLDPIILKYSKTFPADTYLKTDHVVWDQNRDMGLSRLAAAVNESGLKYKANPMIFKAIFDDQVNLSDPEQTKKWITAQKSFNAKKLLDAYNSFGNEAQAKKMADRTQEYNITSTPTVIVGGKYEVIFNNGFTDGMKTIGELIQKVRDERGMKQVAPKAQVAPAKSKGASFAGAANK